MTKSKSSAVSIAVPSSFVMYLKNGAQFLNVTSVARLQPIKVMACLTKI